MGPLQSRVSWQQYRASLRCIFYGWRIAVSLTVTVSETARILSRAEPTDVREDAAEQATRDAAVQADRAANDGTVPLFNQKGCAAQNSPSRVIEPKGPGSAPRVLCTAAWEPCRMLQRYPSEGPEGL